MTQEQWQNFSTTFMGGGNRLVAGPHEKILKPLRGLPETESCPLRAERTAVLSSIILHYAYEPRYIAALRDSDHPFLRATLRPEAGQVSSEAGSPVQHAFAAEPHFDPNVVGLIMELTGSSKTPETEDKREVNSRTKPIWATDPHKIADFAKTTQAKTHLLEAFASNVYTHPKKELFLASLRQVFSPEALNALLTKIADEVASSIGAVVIPEAHPATSWSPGYFSAPTAAIAAAAAPLSPDDPFVCLIRQQCDDLNLPHRIPSPAAATPQK